MSAEEIDQYLDALQEPKRTTLARLRQTILDILPEAEQGISTESRPSRSGERPSRCGSSRPFPADGSQQPPQPQAANRSPRGTIVVGSRYKNQLP